MTKKPDDKSSAILSFPQTQTERTKMRNRAECGDRIRAYRKARELSQPQLAAMLGITKNSITNWETGVSRPELSMIPKLCHALGITADVFFDMPAGRQPLSNAEQEHKTDCREAGGIRNLSFRHYQRSEKSTRYRWSGGFG